ncbi:hypothetical protein HHI36_003589 [Cryptolaemus montrouzieri]|uniref:Chemosensory protein n=1 Tax=Cryptolaemus montrouzieri TaxID=559131 RepID=A0ABD2PEL7_9CUCU
MKVAVVLFVCFIVGVFCDSKLENVDIEAILKNDRLLMNYHKCLMEGTGCTPEGDTLRKRLPEALETGCAQCSEKETEASKRVSKFLMTEKPELWQQLLDKYDPDKKYRAMYEEKLKQ